VSLLPSGLLLIEFLTQSLCDWVHSRLWHIHNQPLLLRKWKVDLEPVVIEPVEVPVWITLKGVPPPLCNHLGVGHLASQIGRPLSKFTRVRTTVKVCVLINSDDARLGSITVQVESKSHVVDIEYHEYRAYEKRKSKDNMKSKQVYRRIPSASSLGNESESPVGEKGSPEEGDKQVGSPPPIVGDGAQVDGDNSIPQESQEKSFT
ncbi:hypothetical protein LINPERPRIM_LOCUS35204, partial [Linum perenne]